MLVSFGVQFSGSHGTKPTNYLSFDRLPHAKQQSATDKGLAGSDYLYLNQGSRYWAQKKSGQGKNTNPKIQLFA